MARSLLGYPTGGEATRAYGFPLGLRVPVRKPPVAGYDGWFDAADTDSLAIVSSQVAEWKNKAGGGFPLLQRDSGKRPDYSTARVLHGVPVPDFVPASNDSLESFLTTGARPFTLFAAGIVDNPGGTSTLFGGGNDGAGQAMHFEFSANVLRVAKEGSTTASMSGISFNAGDAFVIGMALDSAATSVRFVANKTNQLVAYTENTFTASWLRVGSRRDEVGDFDGAVAEIILWHSELSRQEMCDVASYLMKKWGIA